MAFRKVGSGGDGGSGSNRVGFVSAEQTGSALTIANHATNFTSATFATPSWKLTLRDSGRASITYGMQVATAFSGSRTEDVDYAIKLQVHIADSRNTGSIPSSGWVDISGIGDNGVVFHDLKATISETNSTHTINGEFPFDLSSLPAGATNNKWLQFRFAIRAHGENITSFSGDHGYIALKSFGIGTGSTNIGPYEMGLSEGASEAGKFVKYNSTGTGFASESTIATADIADGAVSATKLGSDSVTQSKIAANSVGNSEMRSNAIGTSEIADGAVSTAKIADNSINPSKVDGITPGSGIGGYAVALNSGGTGFEAKAFPSGGGGGGGGGLTSVAPGDLNGVTGGSGDASKFIKTDSTGNQFEAADGPTLSNITGILGTTKGGTGINAADLNVLRQKFGITDSGAEDTELLYAPNADIQTNESIQRIDGSTTNIPTGVADGILIRTGNDQFCIDLLTGKQWTRTLTNTLADTSWTDPVESGIAAVSSGTEFVALPNNGVVHTSTSSFLPSFSDGSKPAEIIVARHDNYLIAVNRENMWWAPRITNNSNTSIPWKWAATSQVPAGLSYTGGEQNEELIPAGESAVLLGQSGIDGENLVTVIVKHTVSGGTSIFDGYFVGTNGTTIYDSRNTRGQTTGDWTRTKVDVDGIDDAIISKDRGSSEPVFHGIIPEIANLRFPGYNAVISQSGMTPGDIYYNSTARSLYVVHLATDTHLTDLFHEDFEVELVGNSGFSVRGVFEAVVNVPGSGNSHITGARFRSEDLVIGNTAWTEDDTIEIKGHKSVITKTDRILPVNLGLAHGASESGKAVVMNSAGDLLALSNSAPIADGSITGAKIANHTISFDKIAPSYSVSGAYQYTQTEGVSTLAQGNVHYSASDGEIQIHLNDADSGIKSELAEGKIIVLFKDPSTYLVGRQSGAITSSGERVTATISRIEHVGTFANNDPIVMYYGSTNQPDSVHKVGLTGGVSVGHLEPGSMGINPGSAIAGHLVQFDSAGTGFSAVKNTSPVFLYGIQSATQTITNNGNDWTNANFSTNTLHLSNGFSRNSPALLTITAVANAGAGDLEAIGFEAKIQARWASSAAGVASATNWTDLVNPSGSTFSGNGYVFRSKVAAGQAAGDRFRDYYIDINRPINLSSLPSGAANGQYVQFRMGIKKAATSFENVGNIYGQALSLTVYPD